MTITSSLLGFIILLLIVAGISSLLKSKYAYLIGAVIYILSLVTNIYNSSSQAMIYASRLIYGKGAINLYYISEALDVVYMLVFIYFAFVPNKTLTSVANTITNNTQSGGKRR